MADALVFNPGSNSLKFELVRCVEGQSVASEAETRARATVDGIGKEAKLLLEGGEERAVEAGTMQQAVSAAMGWLREEHGETLSGLDFVGVRVVHGGATYASAVRVDAEVRKKIEAMEELAPLHNQSSIEVFEAMAKELPEVPVYAAFDTAFHRTLPETAWRYAIDRETADRFGVRKYGFHGISHRYMLEQYAWTVGKPVEEVSIVTFHLESGCSGCAIAKGRSVDTTMGMTPLEGLMMGTRSGSVDPAIVGYLAEKMECGAEEIVTLLNKRSGLLGIAGGSLDTRVLVERDDEAARMALGMFGYRVRMGAGAYLAALGEAEAVLLGGGIGEDSPWLRAEVCAGLRGWGLELDEEANRSTEGMRRVSREGSRLHVWAMPVDEARQIAHECLQALVG